MDIDVKSERKQFGPWSVLCSEQSLVMTGAEKARLLELAKVWQSDCQSSFSEDTPTYVQNYFGLAGLIIRFDYTIRNSEVKVYEIEERPAIAIGMWSNPDVNAGVRQMFDELEQYSGRKVKVLISKARKENTDDWMLPEVSGRKILTELHSETPCKCSNNLYYVRSHRTEEYLWQLGPQSVTTIKAEGSKSYGEELGLWSRVSSPSELDFNTAFVLKPMAGSRAEEIIFFSPDKSMRGRSTRTKVERFFERNPGGGYLQELIMPETAVFLPETYGLLRRSYLTYSPFQREWKILGGVWLATDNIKIHGTPDALTGVIINSDYANEGQIDSAPTSLLIFYEDVSNDRYRRISQNRYRNQKGDMDGIFRVVQNRMCAQNRRARSQ